MQTVTMIVSCYPLLIAAANAAKKQPADLANNSVIVKQIIEHDLMSLFNFLSELRKVCKAMNMLLFKQLVESRELLFQKLCCRWTKKLLLDSPS